MYIKASNRIGGWLELLDDINIVDDIRICYEKPLYIKPPNEYDSFIPTIRLEDHMEYSIFDTYDYFDSLITGPFNIMINDVQYPVDSSMIECSYCTCFYEWCNYCSECEKYICETCAINAVLNDAVQECLSTHGENWVDKNYHSIEIACDVCRKSASWLDETWYCCRRHDQDLCEDCYHSTEVPNLYQNGQPVQWQRFEYKKYVNQIGSFLDWVPLCGIGVERVLYNINPDSEYYHQVILTCRAQSYWTNHCLYPYTLEETIDHLVELSNDHNSPICQLIRRAGYKQIDL